MGVLRQIVPVDGGGPVVALTFDDGPDPTWTPQVLNLLRDAGIHATFCLIGMRADGGSEGVGKAATDSVVACSLLVLAADVLLVGVIKAFQALV